MTDIYYCFKTLRRVPVVKAVRATQNFFILFSRYLIRGHHVVHLKVQF